MSELHKKNDVSDLDSVLSFSPAGAVPRWFHPRGKTDFDIARRIVHGARSSRIGMAGEVGGASRNIGGLEKTAIRLAEEAFLAHDQLFGAR